MSSLHHCKVKLRSSPALLWSSSMGKFVGLLSGKEVVSVMPRGFTALLYVFLSWSRSYTCMTSPAARVLTQADCGAERGSGGWLDSWLAFCTCQRLQVGNEASAQGTSVSQCSLFLGFTGCQEIAEEFRSQEIDGQALLLLKEEHLMSAMNIKLGPALKICAKINVLKET